MDNSFNPPKLRRRKGPSGGRRIKLIHRILERDGPLCWLCEKSFVNNDKHLMTTLEHVIPLSKGGSNGIDNLKLTHSLCNRKRGDTITWSMVPTIAINSIKPKPIKAIKTVIPIISIKPIDTMHEWDDVKKMTKEEYLIYAKIMLGF